jgi:hypothetical protein
VRSEEIQVAAQSDESTPRLTKKCPAGCRTQRGRALSTPMPSPIRGHSMVTMLPAQSALRDRRL